MRECGETVNNVAQTGTDGTLASPPAGLAASRCQSDDLRKCRW